MVTRAQPAVAVVGTLVHPQGNQPEQRFSRGGSWQGNFEEDKESRFGRRSEALSSATTTAASTPAATPRRAVVLEEEEEKEVQSPVVYPQQRQQMQQQQEHERGPYEFELAPVKPGEFFFSQKGFELMIRVERGKK